MKRISMVLPLAVLLAYCSGPNNTQTTTDTDMNGTSSSASASTTGTTTTDMTASSSDVSSSASTSVDGTDAHKADIIASASSSNTSNTVNIDPSDPMYQHFQKVNGESWTWDMNYPGYDRPTAGTYNAAVNGNWQLVMTPELVSAWRGDNSRSLWSSGYAYDGRYLGGNTYLSASESFNTKSSDLNGSASVQVNGSSNAGTLSTNTTATTSGLNNNASANSSTANQMNGNTSSTNIPVNNNANPSTGSGSVGGSIIVNGGTTDQNSGTTGTTSGSVSGNAGVNTSSSATVSGSTDVNSNVNGSTSSTLNGTTASMDVNSVNYNAANGNLYQMPKFNLYLDNGSFTAYTGCNSVSGRVSVSGNSLRFLNTEPSTSIDCLGGLDQTVLLDLLRRIDSYSYVGDELQLMQGNQVLLRFKKGSSTSGLQ